MGFKKVLGGLKKVAPIAAQVAASGLLGSGVAEQVCNALGLSKNASEDDVEKALANANPEQLVRLREIEAETARHARDVGFQTRQLETREKEIAADDRDSARKREIAVQDSTPRIFAWIALGGFLGLLLLVILRGMPDDKSEPLVYVGLTALGTILTQVAAYYFGSSSGSKDKTAAMSAALRR